MGGLLVSGMLFSTVVVAHVAYARFRKIEPNLFAVSLLVLAASELREPVK